LAASDPGVEPPVPAPPCREARGERHKCWVITLASEDGAEGVLPFDAIPLARMMLEASTVTITGRKGTLKLIYFL
jgi:hypothetical protein